MGGGQDNQRQGGGGVRPGHGRNQVNGGRRGGRQNGRWNEGGRQNEVGGGLTGAGKRLSFQVLYFEC